jgi:hypothetical protein
MKIIAWNLPQFHEIEENNAWWGKGFTEWTNVRGAKSLFKGHVQPRIPCGNYYSMLDKKTVRRQWEQSKKYNIYGFCYYHYWFNGKLLLQKPVENLLKWKDINQKFCFSWANEPWTRAWDGLTNEVLMPQEYGGEESWERHINYLTPFFKDERYIKDDNRPIFLLYKSSSIPNVDQMISFFNHKCIQNGFDGIHVMETLNMSNPNPVTTNASSTVYMEPSHSIGEMNAGFLEKASRKIFRFFKGQPTTIKFENLADHIVRKNAKKNTNKIENLGTFVSWDNTPRRGKDGLIISGSTPNKFGALLKKQLELGEGLGSQYVFVNAWNEWAEGAYLEPDMINGFEYLESIAKAVKKSLY